MGSRRNSVIVPALLVGALLLLALAPGATAQGPGLDEDVAKISRTTDTVGVKNQGARDILKIGSWPMYILVGMSFLAVALILYFFFVLRQEQVVPRALRGELTQKLTGGTLEDAQNACRTYPSPLASVTLAVMDFMQTAPGTDPALLKDVIEDEGRRQAESIHGQTRYLMDIAAVAPMIGLLGTVLGMVKAFGSVAVEEAVARPVVLADGVRQALYTTAAGLLIAIPAMIFYSYFREKANSLASQLEAASSEVLARVAGRRNG